MLLISVQICKLTIHGVAGSQAMAASVQLHNGCVNLWTQDTQGSRELPTAIHINNVPLSFMLHVAELLLILANVRVTIMLCLPRHILFGCHIEHFRWGVMVVCNVKLWHQIKRYGLTVQTWRIIISSCHVCTVMPYTTRRHYVSLYHRMMPTQLYHNVLFATMTLHYMAPLCLTISPMMHARLQHNVLFGTISSHYMAP